MKKYSEQLLNCILFKGISKEDIMNILEIIPYRVSNYKKDEIVAMEDHVCDSLGIILQGKVEIQKIFPSGQVTTINNFDKGSIFGEAPVFSGNHKYPATVTATEYTEIMYIKETDIISLLKLNNRILSNFLFLLSNRIMMLSQRITNLSQDTIRKKIATFLLNEYKKQNSTLLTFSYTRKEMAELLNIPRPSLSRELSNMKRDNIIDFNKNIIKILKIDLLEEALFE